MLKKLLLLISLALILLIIASVLPVYTEPPPTKLPNLSEQLKNYSAVPPETIELPLIQEINAKNGNILQFYCTQVDFKVWQGGQRYKLTGTIFYEKPQKFRMEVFSFLGKELDIGSNNEAFWYWSNRDQPPALYWAKHEDYTKTRLKTPFNSVLMKTSLGFESLAKNYRLLDNPKNVILLYPQQNSTAQELLLSIFVDKEKKQVSGFIVSDLANKSLVTCEIKERNGNLPKTILYNWHEENKVMLMTFTYPKVNLPIRPETFVLPNYSPKINMGEY